MGKVTVKTLIKREETRLLNIFKKVEENKLNIVKPLIENAAFMAITLQKLQETMMEKGVVSEYKNGENQFGTKKSPEVEIYNTMVKNYSAVIKMLSDLAPDDSFEKDLLLSFITGGGK